MDAPPWIDELDLRAGGREAAMGTHALEEPRWLLVDDDWPAQRAAARALLDERRSDVLAGSLPEAAAALDAEVRRWLDEHASHVVDDHVEDDDALARARRRIAEDLCLLTPGAEGWVLAAGCVCFPSYWRLRDKLGRPLPSVHDPVPGYAGALAARVDGFLGRLRPGHGVWRRNWSIHPTSILYVPDHAHVEPLPPVEQRWLRSEHQTLRRLEGVAAVVFTIRTQQVEIGALASRPDRAADLASVLEGWTPRQRAYKGGAVDDDLLRWLRTGPQA